MRSRTPQDNERYDKISRKVAREQRVDPRDFRSSIDYLKWCDRVADGPVISDGRGHTAIPWAGTRSDYDEVRKLQG